MIKKFFAVALSAILLISLAGCMPQRNTDNGKINIIATLFPQYDFARQIAGDKANVTLLLPPGMDSHSYDPTPSDVINISKSDIFIYTGKYMEVWAENLISGLDTSKVKVVDASNGVTLHKEEEDEDEPVKDEHHHEYDPHIWTNPQYAKIMVDNIVTALCEADAQNADYYKNNAEAYKKELDRLDNDFQQVVSSSKHKEIYFGGRFALYYFAERYGLKWVAAFDSCSTETEPSAKVVAQMISEMKQKDIKVIYYEELVDPKAAKAIAAETGAKTLLLHSCHNVSKEDLSNGVTYLSLMEQNVKNLKEGLS